MRVGFGYDIHVLQAGGGALLLGGHAITQELRLVGHSDGDVLLHAVSDAILGAVGLGDMGAHFPSDDPALKDADSASFLREAVRLAAERGLRPGNIDCTVVAGRPRLGEHRHAIECTLAEVANLDAARVNLKLKSNDGLDATGRGEAIAAYAVVLLLDESE
ncbi:MAG: 2-C-methyl-D-erythritol 2,4-cyclodiphosphate synthase [Dehalococcoidia bacterium]|nr:2-C-methyl-D-erythritol 2,4-cyclodiphosphate synthase [Dehalococcoidia bacterium]